MAVEAEVTILPLLLVVLAAEVQTTQALALLVRLVILHLLRHLKEIAVVLVAILWTMVMAVAVAVDQAPLDQMLFTTQTAAQVVLVQPIVLLAYL